MISLKKINIIEKQAYELLTMHQQVVSSCIPIPDWTGPSNADLALSLVQFNTVMNCGNLLRCPESKWIELHERKCLPWTLKNGSCKRYMECLLRSSHDTSMVSWDMNTVVHGQFSSELKNQHLW